MGKKKPLPSREEILTWLKYDPETGILTRIRDPRNNPTRLGPLLHTNGRSRIVGIGGSQYLSARIIWRIMTGEDPGDLEVDHIDLNPVNDRWQNLRLATRTEQMGNRPRRKDSSTGFRGIHFRRGKFYARVRKDGKTVYGPKRDTAEIAFIDYQKIVSCEFGEFANTRNVGRTR